MVSSCQEQMTTQGPVNPGLLGSTHHVSLMNRHGTEHKLFHPLFHFSPSSFPPLSFPCICIFPKANQSLLWSDLNFSPDTAHSKLILCENKKRASSRENVPQNDATPPHTHTPRARGVWNHLHCSGPDLLYLRETLLGGRSKCENRRWTWNWMGSGCLLRYSAKRGVVCRMSREEFLGGSIWGRGDQCSHFPTGVSVAEASAPTGQEISWTGKVGVRTEGVSFYNWRVSHLFLY